MASTSRAIQEWDEDDACERRMTVFETPATTVIKHVFKVHNYKHPTFCAHCGDLLVGMTKQGARCKRCGIDVHQRCRHELEKPCVEIMLGRHNFQLMSYRHLTYCDYCKELLVGLVRQGLRCSECKANVHERCQEKIDIHCDKLKEDFTSRTQSQGSPRSLESPRKGRGKRFFSTQLAQETDSPRLSEPGSPARWSGRESNVSSQWTTPDTSPSKVHALQRQAADVQDIVKASAEKLLMRNEKLDNLQDKSEQLNEQSKIFAEVSKEIKKKYWWKNKKYWIVLAVVTLLLVAILTILIVINR